MTREEVEAVIKRCDPKGWYHDARTGDLTHENGMKLTAAQIFDRPDAKFSLPPLRDNGCGFFAPAPTKPATLAQVETGDGKNFGVYGRASLEESMRRDLAKKTCELCDEHPAATWDPATGVLFCSGCATGVLDVAAKPARSLRPWHSVGWPIPPRFRPMAFGMVGFTMTDMINGRDVDIGRSLIGGLLALALAASFRALVYGGAKK